MRNKVLLLAGGLGSRLKNYTSGQYPKLLLSLGNETMLDKLIFTWFESNGVEEMLIVLSEPDYIGKVQKYINIFHPNKPIKLCLYPKTDGTFKTIFYVLNKYPEYQENVYLSWSDIVPLQIPKINDLVTFTLFTDKNKIHRYLKLPSGIVYSPAHKGDIMGLYFYQKLYPLQMLEFYNIVCKDDNEVDFVDYLMEFIPNHRMATVPVKIIDIGDVSKYEEYLETQSVEQRWFNTIEFTEDTVTKSVANSYGVKIIEAEKDFYKHISETDAENSFPIIQEFTSDGFIMENLESAGYSTVHKILQNIDDDIYGIPDLIESYENARIKLNGKLTETQFNESIYKEYIQVPIERFNKIEYFIPKN